MTDVDILFLFSFIAILFLGLGVPSILMFSQVRAERNPFDDPDDLLSTLRTTIIDVKTNEAGVKWVKYYYTRSGPNCMWFTDKLDDYLKYRYRIQEAE